SQRGKSNPTEDGWKTDGSRKQQAEYLEKEDTKTTFIHSNRASCNLCQRLHLSNLPDCPFHLYFWAQFFSKRIRRLSSGQSCVHSAGSVAVMATGTGTWGGVLSSGQGRTEGVGTLATEKGADRRGAKITVKKRSSKVRLERSAV
ncbi:hypothetical protein AVEN_115897-1, partial [Araneus ventricosus]